MARSDMRDFEWDFIKKLLPNKSRGVKRVDDRRVINGILYALRSPAASLIRQLWPPRSIPWRDMPEQYGPWSTIYNRFNRWSKAGISPDMSFINVLKRPVCSSHRPLILSPKRPYTMVLSVVMTVMVDSAFGMMASSPSCSDCGEAEEIRGKTSHLTVPFPVGMTGYWRGSTVKPD